MFTDIFAISGFLVIISHFKGSEKAASWGRVKHRCPEVSCPVSCISLKGACVLGGLGQGMSLGHGLWYPSCPEHHFSNLLKQTQFGSYWWRELWTLSISDVKMSKFCGYLVLVLCELAKLRGKWRAVEQFGTSTPKQMHVPMHTLGQQQIAQSRGCRRYRCYRADGQNPASVRLVEILTVTAIHEIFLYRY